MKKQLTSLLTAAALTSFASTAMADTYMVDNKGNHAFFQFRVLHIGYSWLYGRFNDFNGTFDYDEDTKEISNLEVTVDIDSLNSNHAERDKHIRSDDFLSTSEYPTATFVVNEADSIEDGKLTGQMTLMGTTQEVTFDIEHVGGGDDPWGGYRQGFQAETTITPADFGLDMVSKLGEAAGKVDLIVSIEAIKQ